MVQNVMQRLQTPPARRLWIWVVMPVAVYLVAALLITWPLVMRLTTHAAGTGYADSFEVVREAWSAREALRDGRSPLHDAMIAYPHGITSRLMASTPLRWVPVMALSFVLPPVAAFNVWLIATLVLNGWAAYWLAMALTDRHRPAALLGGLAFMAFPTMQGHLSVGHVEVLAMYGLPLFALCLWRVLRGQGGWRTALWGGVWLAVASLGISSQIIYHAMPVALFLGVYHLLAGRLVRRGVRWTDQPWLRAAALFAFGGLLLLPFFAPLLAAQGRAEVEALRTPGRVTFSADPLTFASLSPFGPLARLAPDYARDVLGTNATEGAGYLGITGLALAVLAVLSRRRARSWLLVALGAMVLSLGPLLKWRDAPVVLYFESYATYMTLPWAALQNLPFVAESRTPGRFNGATALAWAALASLGASVALRRLRSARAQTLAAALLAAVMLLEYQLFWPFPMVSASQPAYFDALAAETEVRAVYNAPALHPLAQMQAMVQQTIHGKPMIAGQLHRRSPQNPALLRVLDAAVLGYGDIPAEAVPDLLHEAGADRLILHKDFVTDAGVVTDRLRASLGAPAFEDARYAVFAVPDAGPPRFVLAAGGDGWSPPIELEGFRGAFLGAEGAWSLYLRAPFGDLVFDTASFGAPRPIEVWLDRRLIGGFIAAGEPVRLPLWAEPGFHTLRLVARGGCTPFAFELACFDDPALAPTCQPIEPPYCLSAGFSPPGWDVADDAPSPLDARLTDGVRLRAYTAAVEGGELRVRLFWEVDRRLAADYALFVHLTDPATGEPRAQFDGFPLVPTREWTAGTRWTSDVTVALEGVAPGRYLLTAGWFDPASGARLGIFSMGEVVVPGGADR